LVTKKLTQWIFNLNSRKSYCLTFTGIYFHPIFFRQLPQVVQVLLQIIYIVLIQSSAKSLILDSVFLQKSFTYTRVRPFVHWYGYRFFGRVCSSYVQSSRRPKEEKFWAVQTEVENFSYISVTICQIIRCHTPALLNIHDLRILLQGKCTR